MALRRRLVFAALMLAAFAALYMLWVRNSFPFAVDELRIEGVTVQSEAVGAALTHAASEMTTLNVDVDALEEAVAGFPTVRSVSISPDFPSGLTIEVHERPPVAALDGGQVAVAGDGLVLTGLNATDFNLPSLEAGETPVSGSLEGEALQQARVLGAAPEPLRPHLARSLYAPEGVTVKLRGGIELRFGTARDAGQKWAAAATVLADPKLGSVSYVDVRIPSRPAAGGATSSSADPVAVAPELATAATAVPAPPAVPAEPAEAEVAPADPATELADPAAPPPTEPVPSAEPTAPAAPPAPAPAAETGAVTP